MRLLPLVLFSTLLSVSVSTPSLVPRAHAEEVKYKSRPNPPGDDQPQYKKPENPPPAQRPPDKEHPVKQPPDTRPEEPPQPPGPPGQGGGPSRPSPPRSCPPPVEGYSPIAPPPHCEPVVYPAPLDVNMALWRRLRLMQVEGFEGQVVVGYAGQVQFERNLGAVGYCDISAVAKAFTAWAVLHLIDSGRLSLATTVGTLFTDAPVDKRRITIEQLLAQTGGLGNTYVADGETDRNAAVSKLFAQPLAHVPGAAFTESDDSYVILAAAIEVASGVPYESYLLQSGVVSGDMTSTLFAGEGASGQESSSWGLRGAGDIFSTAHDLFSWTSHFLDAPVRDEIIRPRASTSDGVDMGYGWYWTGNESEPPLLRTSGISQRDQNVMVVVYPSNAILVVTSDRFYGGIPWSERVANSLEPVLRAWRPPDPTIIYGVSNR